MSSLTWWQKIMQRGNAKELNLEGFEMQKWNRSKDKAQAVDEKNEVICLGIMLTTRFTVIKMSKMGHIFVFSAHDSKKSVIIWAKNLSASERSQLSLL